MASQPRFAPDFRLEINGSEIPSALRASITSVRYEDGKQAADRVEVGIANVDLRWLQKHIRGLGFQPFPTGVAIGPLRADPGPDGLFDVDNSLKLALGYAAGPLEDVFDGEVTGVEASFPSGGVPGMTLVAHDKLHRLTQGSYARGFGPLPDVLIAAILSAENLLIPALDPALAVASTALAAVNYIFGGSGRKQKSQSDLDFLKEIAATYDAEFWVEGDVLYFSRFFFRDYSPSLTLKWGESLLDFTPKVSTVGRVVAAGMKFTLREIPISFLVSVFWDFDREVLGVSVVPGEAASAAKQIVGPTVTLVDQPITSPADIANSALAIASELRRKLNQRLTATGSAVGDPRIRAGTIIRIDGLGPDFSGDYRVASASHSIDTGGYRTTFQVYKEILP
ncbi:MAG: phage late control D family protein [Longimicrobiales bacterium]